MAFRGSFLGYSFNIGRNPDSAQAFIRRGAGSDKESRNLNNVMFPRSYVQAKTDLKSIMDAREEAELASWPYRVALQKIYEKALQNGHVAACIQRRKELTILRDFVIENANGEVDKEWTEYFKKAWFVQNALPLTLDAQYHGFSLVSIGEIKDGVPNLITNVRRWNISPDREHVSIFEYMPAGFSWNDKPWSDWHVWIPTFQPNGINNCGYGLLYVTSILETLLRNNVAYNADFIEMFAQPYRWLKTNDLEGEEFEKKKEMMRNMGSAGFGITGLNDELEFLTDGARGNGYKSYNDFDHRCKQDISKWIGGHADFIDSATKTLTVDSKSSEATDDATGNSQVQKAIAAKRMIDGDFATNAVNELWIPKLQALGVMIPKGHRIHFLNDSEERAVSAQEAEKNQKWATLALTMAQGGLKMPAEFFKAQTGVDAIDAPIEPDKNVMKDPKEQAAGKGSLKDDSKKRDDKPRKTSNTAKNIKDA